MNFWDFLVYASLLGSILFFGGAAIFAMAWGLKNGEFQNFQRASQMIFDPDEPIGQVTDGFPGSQPPAAPANTTTIPPVIEDRLNQRPDTPPTRN